MPDELTSERPSVLTFGDLIDDIVVVPSGPVRVDTDTPSSIRRRSGGSAANTVAWIATRGVDAAFSGRCGAADAERHRAELSASGVTPHLIADDDRPTGTIVVIVEGELRAMLTERGANAAHSPDDIGDDLLSGRSLVHATGYSLIGHAEAFTRLVERAHAAGARVSLNAGATQAIDEVGADAFARAISGVDILLASEAEAALLTGRTDGADAAEVLADRHPIVVVTRGSRGCVVVERGSRPTPVAAVAAASVDPTGAGDAFAAGFLSALVRGEGAETAARAGVALAAQAVTVIGARPER